MIMGMPIGHYKANARAIADIVSIVLGTLASRSLRSGLTSGRLKSSTRRIFFFAALPCCSSMANRGEIGEELMMSSVMVCGVETQLFSTAFVVFSTIAELDLTLLTFLIAR